MFSNLADKLSEAFKRLRSKGKLTEADVKVGMREIKLALLEADVNFKVVKAFVNKVSERCSIFSEVRSSARSIRFRDRVQGSLGRCLCVG